MSLGTCSQIIDETASSHLNWEYVTKGYLNIAQINYSSKSEVYWNPHFLSFTFFTEDSPYCSYFFYINMSISFFFEGPLQAKDPVFTLANNTSVCSASSNINFNLIN